MLCYTGKNEKGEIGMKRAIAGLLAGLLVLSLAACHEREVQTQQTPETMQEEAPAPEAKPEEKMPAAPETEPEETNWTRKRGHISLTLPSGGGWISCR